GGEHDALTVAARLHPVAEHGLRFAALVAGDEPGVDVGGVDEIEPGVHEGVEDLEGCRFIQGPAEHIAAEHQRCHADLGVAQLALIHAVLQGSGCREDSANDGGYPNTPARRSSARRSGAWPRAVNTSSVYSP